MSFTSTEDRQLYGLEVSFSNILTIGTFCSKNRKVIFCKTEKKIISHKLVRNHTFMTSKWKGVGVGSSNFHMFADFFVFKQKIYRSILQMEGVGYPHLLWTS